MITVGHDSEFALYSGGQVFSALDVLDKKPVQVGESGSYFPDNLNVEIAISPVDNLKDFHQKTEDCLNAVRSLGYSLLDTPTVKYDDRALDHKKAFISGCNTDYCGYRREANESPNFRVMDGTRSLGGHIHIGDKSVDPFNLSRWMDIFLGLHFVMKEPGNTRRELYGKAGCLRPKPYGMEYRTLSSVWVQQAEDREFVWEGLHKAVEWAKKGDYRDYVSEFDWRDIPHAINTGDKQLTSTILDRLYIFNIK